MALDISKVRYISLIRVEGGESILNIPYAEMTVDPDLIAGFVTAVIIFARTPIRTIRKAAYDILIEVGDTVLILLVVDPVPDEAPYRERMKRILANLEEEHGEKLRHFEGDVRRYREFTLDIISEFPFFISDLDLVPIKVENGSPIVYRVGKIDRKLEQVEAFINGKRTVSEIMDMMQLPEKDVLGLISILGKHKSIEFKRRLTEHDILVKAACSEFVLSKLKAQYGQPLEDLYEKFDGNLTIKEIIESLPYDTNAIWFIINKLVEEGCLEPN
ncbi:MAG: hypothetical protein JSW61_11185 [Candidatus Thorarchaeota archaeon]|nr:MAG: hypothetical protein JSW61_11185 [Candidatus Thorarchaeota archaeon]